MGKFREPNRSRTGDWTKDYETMFWHPRPPLDVKYQIEKTTGQLLKRVESTNGKLVFTGESNPPPLGCRLRLAVEAAYKDRIQYSLHLNAYLSKVWYEEPEFIEAADRAFEYWTRNLQTAPRPRTVEEPSTERYAQLVRETLAREAQESQKVEDQDPIHALQTAVLDALRRGKRFLSAHHEGGSVISFDGKLFVKEDYGEEEGRTEMRTDEEMIRFLRTHFDWESRRDTYPHKPPELDVWKYIERQLR